MHFGTSLRRSVLVVVAFAGLAAWTLRAEESAEENSDFARTTIDVGVVVSDIAQARAFYKDALGFTETDGFDVPADFAAKTGLSDDHPFHVHVLVLGKGEDATRLKLMQFPKAPGQRADRSFIHSTYGPSYLTIFVTDLSDALDRAKKHGVKPLAKGPVPLPDGFPADTALAIVRDPDGTLIELVGKP